jgi:hypothetical protein
MIRILLIPERLGNGFSLRSSIWRSREYRSATGASYACRRFARYMLAQIIMSAVRTGIPDLIIRPGVPTIVTFKP